MLTRGWVGWGGDRGSHGEGNTEFQFGMMKIFWKWMGYWLQNNVTVVNTVKYTLKMLTLVNLYYAYYIIKFIYFATIKNVRGKKGKR